MRLRTDAEVDIDPAIEIAADRLVQATGAEAVILFGSRARGDNRPDSDWDICVVVPDDARPGQFTPITLWPIVSDLGAPIQIVPVRRCIFEAKRSAINSISHDVDRDGIVLRQATPETPAQ
jgi:uncharacterized protein